MKKIISGLLSICCISSLFALPKNLIFKEVYSGDIKNILINIHSENLTIKEIYGNEITIEVYSNNKRNLPNIECSGNDISILGRKPKISFGEYCDIEVCIPQDIKFDDVRIKQSSGICKIQKIEAKEMEILSTSGTLTADYLSSDTELKIERTSGSAKLGTVACDELYIYTTSGSCKIEKINSIDAVIKSTSGMLKVGKLDTESFDLIKTSGSTNIEKITADYFSINSTSGSISLEFESAPVATSRIRSTSGSVKLYFLSKDGFNLDFSSSSGTFNDTINNNRFAPRGTVKQSYFGGGADIQVSTTSGSFTIGE